MTGIGTLIFAIGILGLFVLDRDLKSHTSRALWIPVVWVLVIGSRPLSAWLHLSAPVDSPEQTLEGSPLDATLWGALLCAGLVALANRQSRVKSLLSQNKPILLFLGYCALSTLWSDYPFVAFKRWTKELGDFVMALIVVSDGNYPVAFKRLLARSGFVLVPLSILFIKYYPDLGRSYDRWNGGAQYTGVTMGKNLLGMSCLIIGLGFIWRFIAAYMKREGNGTLRSRRMLAHGSMLIMVAWLFRIANSMTSISCCVMTGAMCIILSFFPRARRRSMIHVMVSVVLIGALAALFFNPGGDLVRSLGRDPSLTGRTEIWGAVLKVDDSPLLGTGFESFWAGPRLKKIFAIYGGGVSESHNGYLEIFLNLGAIGLLFLALMIISGYRNALDAIHRYPDIGVAKLAFFVTAVIYNLTEAAFKALNPMWVFFLIAIIRLPETRSELSDISVSPAYRMAVESDSSSVVTLNKTC
jgi:exopolysaccharide production protein ExoQ